MAPSFLPITYQGSVAAGITLSQFRAAFSLVGWTHISRTIRYTRAYEAGIDLALALLRAIERFSPDLTQDEADRAAKACYRLLLGCLDRLDRWEEYLSVWDQIRANTGYYEVYTAESPARHGEKMAPFLLGRTRNRAHVHFLYHTHRRRALIEKKLAKARAGGKVGNLLHARQSDLSEAEMEDRKAWLQRLLNFHA